jgi:predicted O-methyltransferase YrrM
MIGKARLRKYTATELGAIPIKGSSSYYMTAQETAILVALVNSAAPKVVIEFGCNLGVTAKRILENVPSIQTYIGIDVEPDHVPTLKCQSSEVPDRAGWVAADDLRFLLLIAPSQSLRTGNLEPCDAVFIDGDHSEAAVLHESRLARRLLRPGGIIVWHDYQNPAVEVTLALDRLHDEGWPINCVEHSWLAFMRMDDLNVVESARQAA